MANELKRIIETFYKSKKIKSIYFLDKNEKKQGLYCEYFENGKIAAKLNYKNDKRDGECLRYYKNGKLEEKANYINGNRHGERLCYYENGVLRIKENYKNDKRDGECLYFDKNGQLKSKKLYIDGIYCDNIKKFRIVSRFEKMADPTRIQAAQKISEIRKSVEYKKLVLEKKYADAYFYVKQKIEKTK